VYIQIQSLLSDDLRQLCLRISDLEPDQFHNILMRPAERTSTFSECNLSDIRQLSGTESSKGLPTELIINIPPSFDLPHLEI